MSEDDIALQVRDIATRSAFRVDDIKRACLAIDAAHRLVFGFQDHAYTLAKVRKAVDDCNNIKDGVNGFVYHVALACDLRQS